MSCSSRGPYTPRLLLNRRLPSLYGLVDRRGHWRRHGSHSLSTLRILQPDTPTGGRTSDTPGTWTKSDCVIFSRGNGVSYEDFSLCQGRRGRTYVQVFGGGTNRSFPSVFWVSTLLCIWQVRDFLQQTQTLEQDHLVGKGLRRGIFLQVTSKWYHM